MTKTNEKSSGNIVIILVILVVFVFIFFKFVAPRLGIKLFKGDSNSIEYSHADGFPKSLNVSEQFEKARLVIKSQEELKSAIEAVDKNREIKIPQVNFDRKIALFVTSKTRSTGGYETRIKKINKDKDDLIVQVRDTEPGKTCIATEQLNLPMDLVILDKTELSVEFDVVKATKECN